MTKESEIKATIIQRDGVPPFTIWSSGFLDMRDGKPIPNSGMPPHRSTAQNIDNAISLYRDVASVSPGPDVKITQVPRIVDSKNIQVFP